MANRWFCLARCDTRNAIHLLGTLGGQSWNDARRAAQSITEKIAATVMTTSVAIIPLVCGTAPRLLACLFQNSSLKLNERPCPPVLNHRCHFGNDGTGVFPGG